jgi:hypothetical protein
MKFYSYANSLQEQKSWKESTNSVIITKNVKNEKPTNTRTCTKNYFVANPISHYRKQYFTFNNSYSRQSVIGTLDKPGSNIVSNKDCAALEGENLNNIHNVHILRKNQTDCVNSNECKRIKRATTVINKKDDTQHNYSSSYREHLNRRCKTYVKNLPQKSYNKGKNSDDHSNRSSDTGNNICVITNKSGTCDKTVYYYPSNTKYMVQGPVTSSSRIAHLKNREKNIYNKPTNAEILEKEEKDNENKHLCCYRKYSNIKIIK